MIEGAFSLEYGFWLLFCFLNFQLSVVQVKFRVKMKQLQFMAIMCTVMLFVVYRTTYYQYKQTEVLNFTRLLDIIDS